MLNKGPYIIEAITLLDDILRRMEAHQRKKTPLLRPRKIASDSRVARRRGTAEGWRRHITILGARPLPSAWEG